MNNLTIQHNNTIIININIFYISFEGNHITIEVIFNNENTQDRRYLYSCTDLIEFIENYKCLDIKLSDKERKKITNWLEPITLQML
jgi:hypothetical protein